MREAVLSAGVDEAGRGPLAGPVVVAAVILDPARPISGLADSKKLSPLQRTRLAVTIREQALAWQIEAIEVDTIDEINILQATMLGMRRVIENLRPAPNLALIDGNRAPGVRCQCRTIVGGDSLEPAISAASILAKVFRDDIMQTLHDEYPHYGFDRHKGYPTRHHLEMLKQHGACPQHRRSYAPVRAVLEEPGSESGARVAHSGT